MHPLKIEPPKLGFGEFVALMALLSSLIALSIDTMLPALPQIGAELGSKSANDNQLIVTALFAGLAFAQLIYGPLSDSIGRKPAVISGCIIFVIGCLVSIFAPTFEIMLFGRVLQGIGVAGSRYISISIIRDLYKGRAMARIMSFVMLIFITVPMLAPMFGQLILNFAGWRMIFVLFLILALIALVWFWARQPETLVPEKRIPFSPRRIWVGIVEVCSHRQVFGYSVASGLVFSSFIGYLLSTQQIFQQQYGLGDMFPAIFALLSIPVGMASYTNAKLVMRLGMQKLCLWALSVNSVAAATFSIVAYLYGGLLDLPVTLGFFSILFFCFGILVGNFSAMAMEPLGHIAGIGAAVVGSLTTIICLTFGTIIGQAYDGTILPLALGFAFFGAASLVVFLWAERKIFSGAYLAP